MSIIKPIIADWIRQYVPILINSICTAICLALAGCRLTADNISVEIESPVSYNHSPTNTSN